MGFKENLRYYRKKKGLSQEGLADKLGVVRVTVTQWETGYSTPYMSKLGDISDVLDVPVARLISDAPPGLPADGILEGKDEYKLIKLYRQLNGEGQTQLLNVAQGLVASGVFRRQPGDALEIQTA